MYSESVPWRKNKGLIDVIDDLSTRLEFIAFISDSMVLGFSVVKIFEISRNNFVVLF